MTRTFHKVEEVVGEMLIFVRYIDGSTVKQESFVLIDGQEPKQISDLTMRFDGWARETLIRDMLYHGWKEVRDYERSDRIPSGYSLRQELRMERTGS